MVMKGDSTLKKTLKTPYGPDDLLGNAAGTGPMSIVTHDEIGFSTHKMEIVLSRLHTSVTHSAFNSNTTPKYNPFYENTRKSTIDERTIHHADLDYHTTHNSAKWNNQRNPSRSSNRYWQEFHRKEKFTTIANTEVQVVIASTG